MAGVLWRDIVNFLGDAQVTPKTFLPLIEFAVDRHADYGYFFGWLPKHLSDASDRAELDRDLGEARIGYTIWADQREALRQWADASPDGPFTDDELQGWWFAVHASHALERHLDDLLPELLDRLDLAVADEMFVRGQLSDERSRYLFMRRIRMHLEWLPQLEMLRAMAEKTWPANTRHRCLWTDQELRFVEEYYSDQQPVLHYDADPADGVDPFRLQPASAEQSLGFGMSSLSYCMYVIMRSTVIDFMDEILEHSRFPQVRGSLQCVECGTFGGRRALGYGQLYCGETCKKRAAKRRYRARVSARRRPFDIP